MKKRFKNIFAKTRKKNRLAVLICTIILTVSMGTLAGCSIAKESAEDVPGQPETEDTKKNVQAENIQTDEALPESGSSVSGTEQLNHHRLKPVGLDWLLKQPKVVRPRSYRSSFVLLNPDF